MSAVGGPPEWVLALDNLLSRLWALERLAPGRDPDKTHSRPKLGLYGPVIRLKHMFSRYKCLSYEGTGFCVAEARDTPDEFTIFVPDLPPETEKAALYALHDWLKPVPYYPPFVSPEERHELQGLRHRLARLAQDRLNELEGKRRPPARLEVGGPSVLLDGLPVQLNLTDEARGAALCLLTHLLAAEGDWRSSTNLDEMEEVGACKDHVGVRWDRCRKKLPRCLYDLTESDHRKGYRLLPAVWRE
jgi:hypothetical protein